ncbi:MAG TPA: DUF4367 domain-containing protein [Gammaproteobacteria bacterium]|nr:DUF4367 domain-containing protein [Gammaproteobacteria bacterium]
MNDEFLNVLRREPSPEFARKLKVRLRALDDEAREPRRAPRAARWAALAASLMVVALAFTFPAVRAGAQAFLDLFRVVNFTGVAFDPERLAKLPSSGLDLGQILGGEVEVLKQPHDVAVYATVAEAGAAAGVQVRTPAWLPSGFELQSAGVGGDGEMRFTGRTANLRLLLDSLAIGDVTIPEGIDGQQFQVRVPPILLLAYGRPGKPAALTLIEAQTPEVTFPAGLDVAALGEIGLRLLGLSRSEAYRIAQTIDWRTTLVVPVPVNAASFRQVNIQGESALLIEANNTGRSGGPPGGDTVLLWSQQGVVHALTSRIGGDTLIDIAQSMQ